MSEYLQTTIDKFAFRVAKDRLYTPDGVWVFWLQPEGPNRVRVGLTDFRQQHSGDAAFVHVKPVGTRLQASDDFAELETIKVNLILPSPVAGEGRGVGNMGQRLFVALLGLALGLCVVVALAAAQTFEEALWGSAQVVLPADSEVFTDPAGRMYACRVTAFEANHEPPSVQEVRDAVVKDLRLEAAGEAAEASAKKLLEAAGEKGLEAAAKKAGVAVEETDWFPRERFIPGGRAGRSFTFPPSLPVVGSSPPVVAECFRLEPGGQERSLVTLARERWAVVLELVGRKPPREPLYQAIRPLLAQEVGVELTSSARSDLLDEEAVRRRLRVIWAPPEAERAPAGEGGDEEY